MNFRTFPPTVNVVSPGPSLGVIPDTSREYPMYPDGFSSPYARWE